MASTGEPRQRRPRVTARRARGLGLSGLGLLVACADPLSDQPDLRPSGPPDVLSVVVARGVAHSSLMLEASTYCRPGDLQRPSRVNLPDLSTAQICPDDVSQPVAEFRNAYPASWYARVVFDELLDLTPNLDDSPTKKRPLLAAMAEPVRLTCDGVEVPYEVGYLSKGTRETWPMAPSLKIKPRDPAAIAAGAWCEVALLPDVVRDKSGIPPEPSQLGPYGFQVAPIEIVIPEGPAGAPFGTTGAVPTLAAGNPPFRLDFNHFVDPASFDASDVRVFRNASVEDPATPYADCGGGQLVPARVLPADVPLELQGIIPYSVTVADGGVSSGNWESNRSYRVELGGTSVSDRAGGENPLPPIRLCFRARP